MMKVRLLGYTGMTVIRMTNKSSNNEYLHIGTIHRKPERFLNDAHFKKYLQYVLRLDDSDKDVPYENTEHNILVIYNKGEETVEYFGGHKNRLRLYHKVQELLDTVDEPIVHDEFFYAVYESEQDEVAIPFAKDSVLHERLVEAIIDQSVKEKEHSLVIYFTQMDDTDENNMYVIRSICVESYLHGNAW